MVEVVVRARGSYSLRLTTGTGSWSTRLPEGRSASAHQLSDGRIVMQASCERAVDEARFVLALDDDTTEFHRLHARDPLIGPTVQRLRGMRTRRKATVTHAVIRAVSGQLIQASRALEMPADTMNLIISEPGMRRATEMFARASIRRAAVR